MSRSLFRYSSLDALLLGGALLQAGLCLFAVLWPYSRGSLFAAALLVAMTVWWSANTVSHNHLHRPIFRSPSLNWAFCWLLTLSTGVPQRLWRKRHLYHHGGERGPAPRLSPAELVELAALFGLWLLLLWLRPRAFLFAYLPGYAVAMGLCQLQGRYEHAGKPVTVEPGVSYYGRLYNLLWWNDGYHGEHHRYPGTHWSQLPARRRSTSPTESSLPPVLRGLEPVLCRLQHGVNAVLGRILVWLERLAVPAGPIQRYMLSSHRQALAALLQHSALGPLSPQPRIGIVGGGLFPRTALLIAELLPRATLLLIDRSPAHLSQARSVLVRAGITGERLAMTAEIYCPTRHGQVDLLIFPLGYVGDRRALYQPSPGQPPRIIHEWLSAAPAEASARMVISYVLLKQLCLVLPAPALLTAQAHKDAA